MSGFLYSVKKNGLSSEASGSTAIHLLSGEQHFASKDPFLFKSHRPVTSWLVNSQKRPTVTPLARVPGAWVQPATTAGLIPVTTLARFFFGNPQWHLCEV